MFINTQYTLAESYKPPGTAGVSYDYIAGWDETEQGIAWIARVFQGGFLGTLNGVIDGISGFDCAPLVQATVERSIEDGLPLRPA